LWKSAAPIDIPLCQTDAVRAGQIRVTLNRRNALTPALAACDYLDMYLHFTTPFQQFEAQSCQIQPPILAALSFNCWLTLSA
jgi:hypothetical protein